MEFLRSAKRRSLISELIYFLLNIGLAIAILIVVWVGNSPLPAFGLVLLSKWRVLAVRPRYWFAHIQANLVDLIVSASYVVLLYAAGGVSMTDAGMAVQIGLTILYCAWLLALKPRTKRAYIVAQAGVAMTVGTIALYSLAYNWPSSVVVIAMFILGYSTARHILSAYSDTDVTLLSFIWGFVLAQIGWLAYHWTIAYSIPLVDSIKLPQVTLIVVAISFLAERIYASYARHGGAVKRADILLPMILSLSILVVVFALFNGVSSGNI